MGGSYYFFNLLLFFTAELDSSFQTYKPTHNDYYTNERKMLELS